MESSFNMGFKLPNQNFIRNNNVNNNINNMNNNFSRESAKFSNSYSGITDTKAPYKSLDGRKWTTKDQEIRANQEYYRNNFNNNHQ